ncbi:MAG: potassium channel protein [Bacteroidetes bacterium]|nr:MAG: potassium channel protein [Bacteroidota bacterium]
MNPGLRKLIFGLSLALLSVSVGIIGFMLIENYSFTQAIYMTAITISTVGFREAKPLSEGGMIFTSAYIMFNLGLFAYIIGYVARFVFDGELKSQYQHYANSNELKKMKDHVIVCGFGRNGSKAVKELKLSKLKCVVIDNKPDLADALYKAADAVVIGDASDEQNLIDAGISKAKSIIIALPSDAENVYITLSARELNPDIQIISRASNELTVKKLHKAGADTVIMPDSLGGKHMAQLITKPSVIQFLNLLESVEGKFAIEQVTHEELKSEYKGKSVREMNIRNMTGVSVVAYQTTGGSFQINPPAQTVLDPGGNFIVLGRRDELDHFQETFLQKSKLSLVKH